MFRPGLLRSGRSYLRSLSVTAKEARKARAQRNKSATDVQGLSSRQKTFLGGVAISTLVVAGTAYEVNRDRNGTIGKLYWESPLDSFISYIYEETWGRFSESFEPSSDKLLPNWGEEPFYSGYPPGIPCPPLVVIDVERTLIASEYDARYGWRHVKRPGSDELIHHLTNSGICEVVLISDNDSGAFEYVFPALDKNNACHKLAADSLQLRDNILMKRLDLMNRDIKKIILIDDNPQAAQLFLENTLIVKPYTDINDKRDSILFELIPLLQNILIHSQDIPASLKDIGTYHAEEATTEFRKRLSEAKRNEFEKRNKGLGGLLRGGTKFEEPDDVTVNRSRILSASDIVGSSPVTDPTGRSAGAFGINKKTEPEVKTEKKKGLLFQQLDDMESRAAQRMQEKQELAMKKYQQKQLEMERKKAENK